jgi:hypothetical protein
VYHAGNDAKKAETTTTFRARSAKQTFATALIQSSSAVKCQLLRAAARQQLDGDEDLKMQDDY